MLGEVKDIRAFNGGRGKGNIQRLKEQFSDKKVGRGSNSGRGGKKKRSKTVKIEGRKSEKKKTHGCHYIGEKGEAAYKTTETDFIGAGGVNNLIGEGIEKGGGQVQSGKRAGHRWIQGKIMKNGRTNFKSSIGRKQKKGEQVKRHNQGLVWFRH